MAALRSVEEASFIQSMVERLRGSFPNETHDRDDEALTQHIRNELTAARSFQLVNERDVIHYLNLGMVYGPGFIERPEYEWMKDHLTDPDVAESGERIQRLYLAVVRKQELEAANLKTLEQFHKPEGK